MNEGDEEEDKETTGESEDEDDKEEIKRRVPPLQIDADSEVNFVFFFLLNTFYL